MIGKLSLSCAIGLLMVTIGSAQTNIPEGNVSGTWDASGSPYLVGGDITIPNGETLFIEPGVTVNFRGHYQLIVNGTLEAEGAENDSIHFTAMNPEEGWGGIRFVNAPDSSHLAYCFIRYGRATGENPDNRGGAIFCLNSNPVISYCTINGNLAANTGGGISCDWANPRLTNCAIFDNAAGNSGGGIYLIESIMTIVNCTIVGNSAAWGGGIYCSNGFTSTITNTIVASNFGNGGINFNSSGNISITYGDFYDNEGGDFAGNVPDFLGLIDTVNANEDSCDVFFNIFKDPLFVNLNGGDFHILSDSPCVDAGDPNSPYDLDDTIADIGAFYYEQPTWTDGFTKPNHSADFLLLSNFPNPFNPVTTIRFYLQKASEVNLTIYNLHGKTVVTLMNGWRQAGNYEVVFDGTNRTSGIYVYRLEAGQFSSSGKMILIK